jgi:3D (Asp-Asp-Asp) domain-containing protein
MNKPNNIILLVCVVLVMAAAYTSTPTEAAEQADEPPPVEPEPITYITVADAMDNIPDILPDKPMPKKAAKPVVADEPEVIEDKPEDIFSGAKTYKITAYCACKKCCGKSDGITASGAKVKEGVTIAMKGLKFGTVVHIEGVGRRVVQDRGVGSGKIDIYMDSHNEALKWGIKRLRAVVE